MQTVLEPTSREATKRPRALIADLPTGIHAYRDGRSGVRVMLGKKFTGAAVVKKRFPTLADAKEFIFGEDALKLKNRIPGVVDLKRDMGAVAFDTPRGVYSEAAAAWEELKKFNSPGGILDAVRFYIKHTALTEGTWTIAEAAVAMEKRLVRLNRDVRYRKGLAWVYKRFREDFPKSEIHEITKSEILDWLDEEDFEGTTKNNYIRDLKVLFNFAEREKKIGINPMKDILRSEVPPGPIILLSIRDIARVLIVSGRITQMQIPTAIKFFGGLRTSEVRRLEWQEIKQNAIVVEARKAKTRARRVVPISKNLQAWLPVERAKEGFVAPEGRDWRRSFELMKTVAGINPWPRNCQRHGFGSFHLAKHKDEGSTASDMGNSADIIVRHYREVIDSESDIESFWNLTPANVERFAEIDPAFRAALDSLEK